MKTMTTALSLFFLLFNSSSKANNEEIQILATYMRDAQTLVETRAYLRVLNEQHRKGIKVNEKEAWIAADKVEQIAIYGCNCESIEQENMLRSQAYAIAAGIYGILSKDKNDIKLGIKSYLGLIKARELNPYNTDAIKGQAVALNIILSKGWATRKIAAIALGINLEDAQRELIQDLRGFPERKDLQELADKLEAKLKGK